MKSILITIIITTMACLLESVTINTNVNTKKTMTGSVTTKPDKYTMNSKKIDSST